MCLNSFCHDYGHLEDTVLLPERYIALVKQKHWCVKPQASGSSPSPVKVVCAIVDYLGRQDSSDGWSACTLHVKYRSGVQTLLQSELSLLLLTIGGG